MGKTGGAQRSAQRITKRTSQTVRKCGAYPPYMPDAAPYEISEFLNIAGHELRAPLTPLKMRLQMARQRIQREGGRERDVDDLSKALYHVERIQQNVALFLDATSLIKGSFTLAPRLSDLGEAARRLMRVYSSADTGHMIRLEETGGPLTGVWDSPRLDVALRELLGNAVKYTTGDITMRLTREGSYARVEVEDAGPAIPASIRDCIFEPYVTGDQSNHGLGLGLYVAREIVHLHGGEMGMDSTASGSLFWLTLPADPPENELQRDR